MDMSYSVDNNSFEIDNTTRLKSDAGLVAWITQANVLLAMFITACFVVLLLDFIHRKQNPKQ